MQRDWAFIAALFAAIHLGAGSGPSYSATLGGDCVPSGQIDSVIESIFLDHPHGGPLLAEELRLLLVKSPDLAQDVIIFAMDQASAKQQTAAAQALAHAQLILSRAGGHEDEDYAGRVFSWAGCAGPEFRIAYTTFQSSVRLNGLLKPGIRSSSATSSNVSGSGL